MPYKDRADAKKWLRKRMGEGYGKALYQVRKRHLENEKLLRDAVQAALETIEAARTVDARRRSLGKVERILRAALADAPPVVRTPMSILGEIKETSDRPSGGRPTRKKGGAK